MRRQLSATLLELLEGLQPTPQISELVRVTSVDLDLPIEIDLVTGAAAPKLLGELPRWRWSTAFDRRPGRLAIRYQCAGCTSDEVHGCAGCTSSEVHGCAGCTSDEVHGRAGCTSDEVHGCAGCTSNEVHGLEPS